jgi:DNA mismatch endonuclease (patch repair protein)
MAFPKFADASQLFSGGGGRPAEMDVVSPRTRSKMMAAIAARDTRPEKVVRSILHRAGFRFRLHDNRLPGRPDIVMRGRGVVIFVHGCFWHRHEGCRKSAVPDTRQEFWTKKFEANVIRDRRNIAALAADGWRILVVWECSVPRKAVDEEGLRVPLVRWILSSRKLGEIPRPPKLSSC